MAVASSPASKQKLASPKSKTAGASSPGAKQNPSSPKAKNAAEMEKQSKRTKSPGVRIVHGRIYDSQNGRTCHQCRQKTLDFTADCKNHIRDKQCTLKFCHTCLLNRYGEKAEEVTLLEDWSCPRCRGICNCSLCMKKRGHQPTGMLVRTAKANGFSSVSDLLHVKGSEIISNYKSTKEMGASPRKLATANESETLIASPRKQGKENLLDGKIDSNTSLPPTLNPVKDKLKKTKNEGLNEMHNGNGNDDALLTDSSSALIGKKRKKIKQKWGKEMINGALQKKTSLNPDEKKPKKMNLEVPKEILDARGDSGTHPEEVSPKRLRVSEGNCKEAKTEAKTGVQQEKMASKKRIHREGNDRDSNVHYAAQVLDSFKCQSEPDNIIMESGELIINTLEPRDECSDADIPLPMGAELTAVAGINLPAEDVGEALQFLEFCAAFGKILNVKKGHAEVVLRELVNGRTTRRGKYSSTVQLHIELLSVIQEDSGSPPLSPTDGKDSWLSALKDCLQESNCVLDSLPLDCLDRDFGGYESLDSSMKLRLLNFLCDEVLETAKLRTWIDDQSSKFAEVTKEAKAKVGAAKHKVKLLRWKMQDDVANAIIAKNGAPLSISEHEAIVSQIKHEAAQAQAEMLDSKSMATKDKQISEVVRTESIHMDKDGRVYWRLKGYSEKSEILCQDIGSRDEAKSGEKWFAYDAEQTNVIYTQIKSLRERKLRRKIQFQGMALAQ